MWAAAYFRTYCGHTQQTDRALCSVTQQISMRYMRIETACEASAQARDYTASADGLWDWAGGTRLQLKLGTPLASVRNFTDAYLAEFDRTLPAWVAVLATTLLKTTLTAFAFTSTGLPTAWRVWVCFMFSFWLESNPKPRVELTLERVHTETQQRRDIWEYRGRMLLLSLLSFGVLWVMQLQRALATWYEVLFAFTIASVARLCIELRLVTSTSWAAFRWASRIALATTCHVSFSCFVVSRLASADDRAQRWWWLGLEFLVYCTARYVVRFVVAYLSLGTVQQHPFVIRRYYTIATDIGVCTGLYCLGDLEVIFALACMLTLVDGIVVPMLARDGLPIKLIHANTSVLWIHLLCITLALPVDLVRGGLFAWYQRLLVCVYTAVATMILQISTCLLGGIDIAVLVPIEQARFIIPIEKQTEWGMQIGSTAFAVIGTLYATQALHRQ